MNGSMAVKKICVLGLDQSGVPLSAIIAVKCPEIRVTVVQSSPDDVFQWNTRNIFSSVYVPGLEEYIRKCHNKNLYFTTNEKTNIKESDLIFISTKSNLKNYGKLREVVDLTPIEEAARLIAEHAESNKIVVENSLYPLKATECVERVLKNNSKPGLEFQVLSSPDFYEQGSPLRNLLFPECVLIGSEQTPEGQDAAKVLASIYERWVTPNKILMRKTWSAELSKICTSVMVAQVSSFLQTMTILCEAYGADISVVTETLLRDKGMGTAVSEPCLNVGKLPVALYNLVYICESTNLPEIADYWRQVLIMFEYHKERFFKKIISALNQTAWKKEIGLLGYAYRKDTEITDNSYAVYLCKMFLEEKAVVNIYDPKVTQEFVLEEIKSAGCTLSEENMRKSVKVYEDPYRALHQCQAIVVCGIWPKFKELDYRRIFAEMKKPAFVFDMGLHLPHSELQSIGYKVYTIGKFIKNN